jgi:hypothetical protein
MEMPRGLMIILALLALGMCLDVSVVIQGGPGRWLMLIVLVGRIAAIAGILMRTQKGWALALSFFVVIIALNAAAAANGGGSPQALAGMVVPAGCAIYLLTVRNEFG